MTFPGFWYWPGPYCPYWAFTGFTRLPARPVPPIAANATIAPSTTVTVIPRRFGVLFSTASPSLLRSIDQRIGSTPGPPEPKSPVRGFVEDVELGRERVERAYLLERAGALVALRREGEGEPRVPRARILGGRATEPVAGQR